MKSKQYPVTALALMAACTVAQAAEAPSTIPVTALRSDAAPAAAPGGMATPDLKYSWGGYIKLDSMYSHFSDGDVATPGSARDFYVPGSIPVKSTPEQHSFFDAHAKETRLWFRSDGTWGDHKVGAYVEMDFLVNPGAGQERTTNAYNPGLRRAYLTFDNWLAGQDWSTFQNTGALPEGLDFIGPTESTVFVRQPQLRYTEGSFQVALENPETTLTAHGGASINNVTGDGTLPDLVLRYNAKTGFGDFTIAGIGRQLKANQTALGATAVANGSAAGYGASASGKVPLGDDDLRFMVSGGKGIGRYVGINTIDDAVVDANGGLQSLGLVAGFVAYRHPWSEQWRSSLTLSTLHANNDSANTGVDVTKSVYSGHLNLLYSPLPKITFGGELTYAKRKLESGLDGDMSRLQLSAKYIF
ncbi:MAG TPA: DcaP family trimeric outer membrane transporter [Nevskiaceae bacterium]|nr:DcaP family trimeric outer membrane transporter [Nevskiaceae bacterium]